jgi:hypothetical protein
MIAREKKLDRASILKQLLQKTVMEELHVLKSSARRNNKSPVIVDPIVVHRNATGLLVSSKENQHEPAWPHYPEELSHELIQQRRNKKLERIPDQRAIKRLIGEREGLVHEALSRACDFLILEKISGEALLHCGQNVVRGNTVSQARNEADVRLTRARHIQNREIVAALQHSRKLFEAAAVTIHGEKDVLLRPLGQAFLSSAAEFHMTTKRTAQSEAE